EASAPSARAVLDAQTIDYADAGPDTYDNNVFTVGDLKPVVSNPVAGTYYLIVAPQAVIQDGALDAFVDFKRRLGFTVEIISVEKIDTTVAGASRLLRVRNLEIARRQTYGSRFRYVMLVGPDSVIPFAKLALGFTGYTGGMTPTVKLNACQNPDANAVGYKYSEWPYADLVSDFDSNGNGCLGDGWFGTAANFAP